MLSKLQLSVESEMATGELTCLGSSTGAQCGHWKQTPQWASECRRQCSGSLSCEKTESPAQSSSRLAADTVISSCQLPLCWQGNYKFKMHVTRTRTQLGPTAGLLQTTAWHSVMHSIAQRSVMHSMSSGTTHLPLETMEEPFARVNQLGSSLIPMGLLLKCISKNCWLM